MISAEKYVDKVGEIYREDPSYRTGGDGSDGTCDCIGMCRGALERAGVTDIHNMRGTNNAVRHLDLNLQPLAGSSMLQLGDIVMRTRDKDDPNMPLPDQYREGGSDYSEKWGETNFTHIGSVTGVYPLEITHMTSPHAKKDTSIKNWTWYGQLPWVQRGGQPEPGPDPDPDPPVPVEEYAVVWSENGKPVNTRKGPDESYPQSRAGKIPVGEIVQIDETTINAEGETWCRCEWTDENGAHWKNFWMKKDFLKEVDGGEEPELPDPAEEPKLPQTYTVHIPFQAKYQAEALVHAYSGAWMTPERG